MSSCLFIPTEKHSYLEKAPRVWTEASEFACDSIMEVIILVRVRSCSVSMSEELLCEYE